MKKTLFIFLSLIIFSCAKDELAFDLNASGDLSEQTIEQAKKTIYGKWDFGNSSKSSGLGKKNSQVTNSIFGKRYARNNSKSSGQGKNLSCAFDFIEFNDNTYIMAIISDDRTEYLSGDYVINENSDKKVTSVDLKLKLSLEEITIATLTDIIVVKTGSNLDATFNISLNFPDDADFASCNSLSGSVSVEKAEPLEANNFATSDSFHTKLIKTWNFDSYVERDFDKMNNDPAIAAPYYWYYDSNSSLQNDCNCLNGMDYETWDDQFWTENLVPSILEEFCLDSERISPTNKEIVIPNCTAPTKMSITFSTYGTYTFFYSGGSDGTLVEEVETWNWLNENQTEIVLGDNVDYDANQDGVIDSLDAEPYLTIQSITDDSLIMTITYEAYIDADYPEYNSPAVTDTYTLSAR